VPPPGREETLEEVRERGARAAERAWLSRALDRSKGDRTAAAESLGLSPRRYDAKLREHGLDQES
jgi:DNA-binding NtrC family response regulator